MAHILEAGQCLTASSIFLKSSVLDVQQHGQHCKNLQRIKAKAPFLDRQHMRRTVRKLCVHASREQRGPLFSSDLGEKQSELQHDQEASWPSRFELDQHSRDLTTATLSRGQGSLRKSLYCGALQGLPAAAFVLGSGVAWAADEIEAPVNIISNEDELSNTIIAVLFTLGIIALAVLTAGVIYLSLSDFKSKREAAKLELQQKQQSKNGAALEPKRKKKDPFSEYRDNIKSSPTRAKGFGPKPGPKK